jgi:NADH dehydrogenase FAD-containing subunit
MHLNAAKVVMIGGEYAGVMAANRLTRRNDVDVTLINPRPTFVHRMRLHQLVAGSDKRGGRLLRDPGRPDPARGGHRDPHQPCRRRVSLAAGDSIAYDYLIYAVGSRSAEPSVPGAAEFAHKVAGLEDAQRARSVIDTTPVSAPVTVVGGGATGIEVASELARAGRNVTLIAGSVLNHYLHPRVRRKITQRLTKLGVAVLVGRGARVTAVRRDAVQLGDGRSVPSAVTLWTAGFSLPDLAATSR